MDVSASICSLGGFGLRMLVFFHPFMPTQAGCVELHKRFCLLMASGLKGLRDSEAEVG